MTRLTALALLAAVLFLVLRNRQLRQRDEWKIPSQGWPQDWDTYPKLLPL